MDKTCKDCQLWTEASGLCRGWPPGEDGGWLEMRDNEPACINFKQHRKQWNKCGDCHWYEPHGKMHPHDVEGGTCKAWRENGEWLKVSPNARECRHFEQ